MRTAVDLKNQLIIKADKIHDEDSDRFLSAEFGPF